jgi:hypothetical protein
MYRIMYIEVLGKQHPGITLTDRVCADLLDEEYATLARHVVAKLAPSGPRRCWAAGPRPGPAA